MKQLDRKEEIFNLLSQSKECITASRLASHFGVTRQVIVSDVALLRANGKRILATQKGYTIDAEDKVLKGTIKVIACKHTLDEVRQEFYTIVDNGGTVIDVTVEHPIYGELSAKLNINSRYEADEFMDKAAASHANQLSDLTDGYHYHTISVPDEKAFGRIEKALSDLGILQKDI